MCTAEGESVQSRDRDDFACTWITAGLFVAVLILERAKVKNADLIALTDDLLRKLEEGIECRLDLGLREPRLVCNRLCNSTDGVDFWCFFLWYHVTFSFPADMVLFFV